MAMTVECLVIGGGAAGTAAAAEAAGRGVEVVLVEVRRAVYGQAAAPNVTALTSSLAWGMFPGNVVSVVTPGDSLDIIPRVTVLATGATDRLLPFPGWEHQHVVTASEALDLARASDARMRWIVAGIAQPGVRAAIALRDLGQDVVLYADVTEAGLSPVRAAHIEALPGYAVGAARGEERIEDVEFHPVSGRGPVVRRSADFLCVAYAEYPATDLAWLGGCAMRMDPGRGGYVPNVRDAVHTSLDGVLVAGAAGGLCREDTAILEGRLAGLAAAQQVGKLDGTGVTERQHLETLIHAARHHDRSALRAWVDAMWNLEDRYVRSALERFDATLCRCEKVPGAEVHAVLRDEAARPGDVKRFTRAGMGECQGRHCRFPIVRAVSVVSDQPAEDSPPTFRPPVIPITLEQLLQTGDG